MEVLSNSVEDTQNFAEKIAKKLKSDDVLALYGDLGSGKTTFTSHLVNHLGINKRVQSPTFVIARKYKREKERSGLINIVNHIDLYRLTTKDEVEDLGLQDMMLEPYTVTIIEWPDIAEDLLPESTIKIYFEYMDENKRRIVYDA